MLPVAVGPVSKHSQESWVPPGSPLKASELSKPSPTALGSPTSGCGEKQRAAPADREGEVGEKRIHREERDEELAQPEHTLYTLKLKGGC